jgi:ubiquinone/menaquinone biosynthesis C-methylase UbiE
MPLTDQFVTHEKIGSEYISDIEIVYCDSCGLAQNPNNFNFTDYYKDYNYSSGHSEFAKTFMEKLSDKLIEIYLNEFATPPQNILEVGSGDGVQLRYFKEKHSCFVTGVEPSDKLSREANNLGVKTLQQYFDETTINLFFLEEKFDITLSSFTLDHIPNPKNFLENMWKISSSNALCCFEIHDLNKINQRGEWCLFEHEHMIYTDEQFWQNRLQEAGFRILSINPLPHEVVRANSLIVIARKEKMGELAHIQSPVPQIDYNKILEVKNKLEKFIDDNEKNGVLGWGLGGRGVMTAALLSNYKKIHLFFDSNFKEDGYYLPKTHIKICNPEQVKNYPDSKIIIFSFGYFEEISASLVSQGIKEENIVSLKEFFD